MIPRSFDTNVLFLCLLHAVEALLTEISSTKLSRLHVYERDNCSIRHGRGEQFIAAYIHIPYTLYLIVCSTTSVSTLPRSCVELYVYTGTLMFRAILPHCYAAVQSCTSILIRSCVELYVHTVTQLLYLKLNYIAVQLYPHLHGCTP